MISDENNEDENEENETLHHQYHLLRKQQQQQKMQKISNNNCNMNVIDNFHHHHPHQQQQQQQQQKRQCPWRQYNQSRHHYYHHHYKKENEDHDDDDYVRNREIRNQNPRRLLHKRNTDQPRRENGNVHRRRNPQGEDKAAHLYPYHASPSISPLPPPPPPPPPHPHSPHPPPPPPPPCQQNQEEGEQKRTPPLDRSNNRNFEDGNPRSKSAPGLQKGPIKINVNGRVFMLSKSTCIRIPVLQGMLTRMKNHHKQSKLPVGQAKAWDQQEELFFERNSTVFSAVVDYVQNNELHVPPHVCPKLFARDLSFWGFDIDEVESCCFSGVVHFLWEQDRLTKFHGFLRPNTGADLFHESEEKEGEDKEISVPVPRSQKVESNRWRLFRHTVWRVLDEPFTGRVAQAYFYVMCLFILTSFFTIAADTEEYFKLDGNHTQPWIYHLGFVCNGYLYLDYILRIIFYPDLRKFLRDFVNITDGLAVVSSIAKMVTEEVLTKADTVTQTWVDAIDSMQLLRILRLLRPMSKVIGFRLIYFTLKCSFHELLLVFMLLMFLTMIFSSLLYYLGDRQSIESIPHAMWFSLTTMTTVGYGDIVPRQARTKVIGSVVAVFGVILMSMTMPIMVSNFNLLYINAVVGQPSAIHKVHKDLKDAQNEDSSMGRSHKDSHVKNSAPWKNESSMEQPGPVTSGENEGIKDEGIKRAEEGGKPAPAKAGWWKTLKQVCCPSIRRTETTTTTVVPEELLKKLSSTHSIRKREFDTPEMKLSGEEADIDSSEPEKPRALSVPTEIRVFSGSDVEDTDSPSQRQEESSQAFGRMSQPEEFWQLVRQPSATSMGIRGRRSVTQFIMSDDSRELSSRRST